MSGAIGRKTIQTLIAMIGDNPCREGLRDTPARVIKAWETWGEGYHLSDTDIGELLTTFEDGGEHYDEFVVVRGIPIYSHCEHHLAPFFGVCDIGYLPDRKIVGLSKLARLANAFARRLQVQERLTQQIAEALERHLQPKAVGVVLECRHLCMESRGIRTSGTTTVTSAMCGLLRRDAAAKAELLKLMGR